MCSPSLTPRKLTPPGDSHRTLPLAASTARSVSSKPVVSTSGPAGHTRSVWPASGSRNSHARSPVPQLAAAQHAVRTGDREAALGELELLALGHRPRDPLAVAVAVDQGGGDGEQRGGDDPRHGQHAALRPGSRRRRAAPRRATPAADSARRTGRRSRGRAPGPPRRWSAPSKADDARHRQLQRVADGRHPPPRRLRGSRAGLRLRIPAFGEHRHRGGAGPIARKRSSPCHASVHQLPYIRTS